MDTKLEIQKATRPASRWRNRWLALRDCIYQDGKYVVCGQEHWGLEWPSRDTAETIAQEWMKNWPNYAKYLGAFPVDA